MFERFTERARQVVVLAQESARAKSLDYVGVEHILYGLCAEEEGLGARVLRDNGITPFIVFEHLPDASASTVSGLPFTPMAKSVLELALREAIGWGHNYIGTEHLLGGLLRELDLRGNQVVANVFQETDTTPEDLRRDMARILERRTTAQIVPPADSHEYPLERETWEVVIRPDDETAGSERIVPFGTTKPRYGMSVDPGAVTGSVFVISADYDDPVVVLSSFDRSNVIIRKAGDDS